MKNPIAGGAALAVAVCGMLGCGTSKPTEGKTTSAMVQCGGINACKGQGSCSGADNACKAQNTCKGKGWVETSDTDCAAKGGTVVKKMM